MPDQPSLLPPSSTPLEQALEQVGSRPDLIATDIAALWNVETCPPSHLPWLAWTLSVDTWDAKWPEHIQRAVIAASVQTHRHKGTLGAVRRALAAIGVRAQIREWWQTGDAPHTFVLDAYAEDLIASGFRIDADLLALVKLTVSPAKPIRSHYTLRVGESLPATGYLRAGSRQRTRLDLSCIARPRATQGLGALYPRAGSRQRLRLELSCIAKRRAA